jgi:hypothetical protein
MKWKGERREYSVEKKAAATPCIRVTRDSAGPGAAPLLSLLDSRAGPRRAARDRRDGRRCRASSFSDRFVSFRFVLFVSRAWPRDGIDEESWMVSPYTGVPHIRLRGFGAPFCFRLFVVSALERFHSTLRRILSIHPVAAAAEARR